MTDSLKEPAIDLDGLQRYGHIVGYDDVDKTPDGEYVLLEDVRALLTPTPTRPVDKPYEVVLDSRDLWDSLRAAHMEGQSCGELDRAESWNASAYYANRAIIGWKTLRRVPADYIGSAVRWAVSELLGVLPEKRDWLNPDVERVLRDAVGVSLERKR
jgi:hypothetical protein